MPWNPAALDRYQVLRISIELNAEESRGSIFLVILGHREGHLLCLQALRATQAFENQPGCVVYEANEVPQFDCEVAIVAKAPRPVPYAKVLEAERNNCVEIFDSLPDDFDEKLREAIKESRQLARGMRAILYELLDSE